jgi:hypothetical protein
MNNDIDIREKDVITIEFTQELLDEWLSIYFKKHPRARKQPIEAPSQPSINKWSILPRISMNKLKQDYKDFGTYVVKHYGLEMLGISKCKCRYTTYVSTKTRIDLDNTAPKFILDSLTAEATGVIVDDGYSCITELTLKGEYKKGVKGSKIEFYDCEYDKELLFKTKKKEINKINKKKLTMEQKKKEKKSKTKKK